MTINITLHVEETKKLEINQVGRFLFLNITFTSTTDYGF